MTSFLVKRMLSIAIAVLVSTVVIFTVAQLPPWDHVDYLVSVIGDPNLAENIRDRLREAHGLDKPLHIRYLRWVGGVLTGDLGYSVSMNQSVGETLGSEAFLTVVVGALAMGLGWLVGIPLGIYSAVNRYKFLDSVLTVIAFIGLSIPNFFMALVILYLSVVVFQTPYIGGLFSPEFVNAQWSLGRVWDLVQHLWAPVLILGTSQFSRVMRVTRGNMLDFLSEQFVVTARAKGVSEMVVVYKHCFRLAMNPLISLAGIQLPNVLAGAVVTAVVLNLPIMGPNFLSAIRWQDMNLVSGYLLVFFGLLLLGNLLADIGLAWSDPRIRYD